MPHPCSDPDHHPAPPGPGGHRGGRRLLQLRLLRPRPGRRQPRLVPGGGGAGGRGAGHAGAQRGDGGGGGALLLPGHHGPGHRAEQAPPHTRPVHIEHTHPLQGGRAARGGAPARARDHAPARDCARGARRPGGARLPRLRIPATLLRLVTANYGQLHMANCGQLQPTTQPTVANYTANCAPPAGTRTGGGCPPPTPGSASCPTTAPS